MFLICTNAALRNFKKSPALGVVWASVSPNLIFPLFSLCHSCVYSLWPLGCLNPCLCLSLLLSLRHVLVHDACLLFCLSLTKDFAQYLVSSIENMIWEKMTVAFIQKSSTEFCKERRVALKTVHRYYQPMSICCFHHL